MPGRARDGRLRRPPPGRAAAGLPRTPTHSGGAAMSRTHWIAAAALAATACGGDPPAAVPPVPVSVVQVGGSSGDTRRDAVQRRDQGATSRWTLAFRVAASWTRSPRYARADGRLRAIQDGDPVRKGQRCSPGSARSEYRDTGGRRRCHAAPVRGGLRARLAAVREPLDQQGRVRRRLRPLHREPGPAEPGGDLPRRRRRSRRRSTACSCAARWRSGRSLGRRRAAFSLAKPG